MLLMRASRTCCGDAIDTTSVDVTTQVADAVSRSGKAMKWTLIGQSYLKLGAEEGEWPCGTPSSATPAARDRPHRAVRDRRARHGGLARRRAHRRKLRPRPRGRRCFVGQAPPSRTSASGRRHDPAPRDVPARHDQRRPCGLAHGCDEGRRPVVPPLRRRREVRVVREPRWVRRPGGWALVDDREAWQGR